MTVSRPAPAAATLALMAVVLAACSSGSGSGTLHTGVSAPGSRAPSAPPTASAPTTKLVSYHGIEITVPARLPVGDGGCEQVYDGVVAVDPGLAYSCPAMLTSPPAPASWTTVTLVSIGDAPSDATAHATSTVTVSGMVGRTGAWRPSGSAEYDATLVLPDPGVVITVEAANPATGSTILGSVRRAKSDRYGCSDHAQAAPPVGDPAGGVLVPAGAKSAAFCEYEASPEHGVRWLVYSSALSTAAVTKFTSVADGLPHTGPAALTTSGGVLLVRLRYRTGTRVILVEGNVTPALVTDGQHWASDTEENLADILFDR